MPRVKKAALEKKSINLSPGIVKNESGKKNVIAENDLPKNSKQEKLSESIVEAGAPNLKTPVKRKAQMITTKGDAGNETPNKVKKAVSKKGSKLVNKKAAPALDNGEVDDTNLAEAAVEDMAKPETTKKRGRRPNKILDNAESLKETTDPNDAVMPKTNTETKRKVTSKRKLDNNLNSMEENVDFIEEKSHHDVIKKKSEQGKTSKTTKKITSTKVTKEVLETLPNNLENDKETINKGKDVDVHLDKLKKPEKMARKKQSETTLDAIQNDGQTNLISPMKTAKKSRIIETVKVAEVATKHPINKNLKEKMDQEVTEALQIKDEIKKGKKVQTKRKKKDVGDDGIANDTENSAVASIEDKFEEILKVLTEIMQKTKTQQEIMRESQSLQKFLTIVEEKLVKKGKTTTRTRTRKHAQTVKANEEIENQAVGDGDEKVGEEEEGEMEIVKEGKDAKLTSKIKRKPNAKSINQPLNKTTTIYNKADFELKVSHGNYDNSEKKAMYNLKISSWNVAGLRSWVIKGGLQYLEYEEPDIFCMQETKCSTEQLPPEVLRIAGYHPYWLCMPGGYAGVAIYSKIMPINVEYGIGNKEFDTVGRLITAEYEKFFLLNVYVPNSGRKLVNLDARMQWEKLFQEFIQKLDKRKPVIICGDMNVSHQEIDLANPKSNTRNAGFTKEEREKMSELLALGYVDTFRHLYPKRTSAYTYWTYMGNARSRNVGWRLDYFIVSQRLVKCVIENCMRTQCLGSDHCPITLFLQL